MSGTCNMHRIDEKWVRNLVGNGKKPFRRPRLKWKNTINMCCKELDREGVH